MDERLPQPRLSSAILEANDEQQALLAAQFRARTNPHNVKFARALAVITETEQIFGDYISISKRKSLLTPIQQQAYADALAKTGDFAVAHKYDKTRGYDKIAKCLWNNKGCSCKPLKQMGQDGKVQTFERQFVLQTVWSVKDNKEVNLMKCADCHNFSIR